MLPLFHNEKSEASLNDLTHAFCDVFVLIADTIGVIGYSKQLALIIHSVP